MDAMKILEKFLQSNSNKTAQNIPKVLALRNIFVCFFAEIFVAVIRNQKIYAQIPKWC